MASNSTEQHRREAPSKVRCVVVTISDTRTVETDTGGAEVIRHLEQAGHQVILREIVPDEPDRIRQLLGSVRSRADIDAILMTGGTGIGSRDLTYETVSSLLSTVLPGYGELFRMLSYQEIGAAAMLSRAIGGLLDRHVLLTMPGSPAAVRLAMESLIIPELPHLVREARR